ncbi:MAG TPA: hypothetical protein QF753_21535 [Victivallales bacterium]|nr:hypothetical protein [Victivallales bacterium]
MSYSRFTDKEKDILFILCISFILTYLFFLLNNLCIVFNFISNSEIFRQSIFFSIFNYIRWLELIGLFIIALKGTYVSYKRCLPKKTPFHAIPLLICFLVIYNPFYVFTFSLSIWMMINVFAIIVIILGLIKAMMV